MFVVVFCWVGFLCGCVFADLALTSSLQKLIFLKKMDLLNAIYPEMRTDFIAFDDTGVKKPRDSLVITNF